MVALRQRFGGGGIYLACGWLSRVVSSLTDTPSCAGSVRNVASVCAVWESTFGNFLGRGVRGAETIHSATWDPAVDPVTC
ncbi:hypothetical protein K0M31_016576 [Melipona bicolor]|uniref:Uncharacterized protein n=1 Tax=Melipona bicolor TaxID=60889 RepID=A0AA40FET4_9HYME|nr:hypothetical protein K0M31_016576 [Melipona bicolor]